MVNNHPFKIVESDETITDIKPSLCIKTENDTSELNSDAKVMKEDAVEEITVVCEIV